MAFKVFRNGQEPAEEFGDKDRLEIIEGGVLKIRLAGRHEPLHQPGMLGQHQ